MTAPDQQKERLRFAFTFYPWVLATVTFLLLAQLLVGLVAQTLGLEAIRYGSVAGGMITLGVFWLLTILQFRGLLMIFTQWGIGQSAKMYYCAQLGLLPPLARKVNQYKIPLILIGVQRSVLSIWFFIQTLFLSAGFANKQFESYLFFIAVSLLILTILPFWLYSRHNKGKHKSIVLASPLEKHELKRQHFALSRLRAKYHIHPAPEDYLPFSKRRKLMREHEEAISAAQEAQTRSKQDTAPEQVVEASEIEYAD
jgi:hypothetical protein